MARRLFSSGSKIVAPLRSISPVIGSSRTTWKKTPMRSRR
jgi:hypothetical protein